MSPGHFPDARVTVNDTLVLLNKEIFDLSLCEFYALYQEVHDISYIETGDLEIEQTNENA